MKYSLVVPEPQPKLCPIEVFVAGIGALLVTIVTLVLLKNQTENQKDLLEK